jgi:hypothetical protein
MNDRVIDTKQAWIIFNTHGHIQDNDALVIRMLTEIIQTIHNLERIYQNGKAQLVVDGMIHTYQALNSIAWNRGIQNIPTL